MAHETVLAKAALGASCAPVMKYAEEERRLAGLARQMSMKRNVLYHGTRYAKSILRTGVLFASGGVVSLTRSPEVAAYFALLPRDDDEGRGTILIFDREQLRCRYRIYSVEEREVTLWYRHDEAEEELWGDVTDISKYLIGFVSGTTATHSDRLKTLNRQRRTQMEARLDDLLNFVRDWRCGWRCGPTEQINSYMKKRELARSALFQGVAIEQVADQVGLSISAVRRLAGSLRRRISTSDKPFRFDWSVSHMFSSCEVSELLSQLGSQPDQADLESALGEERMKSLITYSGRPREDVLSEILELFRRRSVPEQATATHLVGGTQSQSNDAVAPQSVPQMLELPTPHATED
jgi:hypothetical protein